MGGQASAVPVGLELMLLVDVSGSVDANEYNLQKAGYVNAFNSAAVQNAILGSEGGAIAVTYVEWSGPTQQAIQVGWTLINSVASAQAFATALNGVSRAFAGNTAVQDAIGKSYAGFGTEVGSVDRRCSAPSREQALVPSCCQSETGRALGPFRCESAVAGGALGLAQGQ